VLRRLFRLLVFAALILTVGAHWAILQSIAWVSMTVAYSQSVPVKEALTKTFDGQHPCDLCHLVASGKEQEREKDQQKATTTRLELFFEAISVEMISPERKSLIVSAPGHCSDRTDVPLLPPPIAA